MLSKHFIDFYLMIILVVKFGETINCIPNKLILLSNCSFLMTNDNNRTLSMIVPYPLNTHEEENSLITIFRHKKSLKPLIRLNLNLIQCSKKNFRLNWTSLESSSTLRGEFLRTTNIDNNIMYLPSGKTYLKNLTTIDCQSQTLYRTDSNQLFQIDLKIESTLNDYCLNDHSCFPKDIYQCDTIKHRCICRKDFQSYLIEKQYPICLQPVQTIDQCTIKNTHRCLEWCHLNNSSPICLCPKDFSIKKFSSDNRSKRYLDPLLD